MESLRLSCPESLFRGDVVLVTDPGRLWTIRVESTPLPMPPPGYSLSPDSTQTSWAAQAGDVKEVDDHTARWIPPAQEGVWTVSVKKAITYRSSNSGGFFRRKRPDIVQSAWGEIRFLVPRTVDKIQNGKINGFTIGFYPDPTDPSVLAKATAPERIRQHPETYKPPKLWYRVDESTKDLRITQDYRLGEFDLDPRFRPEPYPHYIAIDPNLLLKLDALKESMNADGYGIEKFDLIYAFRSPHYNLTQYQRDGEASLKSYFSVHMYGKAADILLDRDGDLVMDDLNGDGRIDIGDARVILRYVDELDRMYIRQDSPLVGGAGVYHHHDFWERGEVAQSPYIHVDVRGFADENGLPIRWVGEDTLARHEQAGLSGGDR